MNETALYDDPALYELLHREGTTQEARLLEDLFRLHGNGGESWLEPACGTGRLLHALARRRFRVTGYDRSKSAVAYARKRLARLPRAEAVVGEMRSFRRERAFDAAFCLLGTFRHLSSDRDALAHLRATAASLRRGGIYILGLDLVEYARACDDEEDWSCAWGKKRAKHHMISLAPTRQSRRERILNFVELREGGRTRLLESSYDLRSYDLAQWKALIARSPFHVALAMTHGCAGGARDALFVLSLKR